MPVKKLKEFLDSNNIKYTTISWKGIGKNYND